MKKRHLGSSSGTRDIPRGGAFSLVHNCKRKVSSASNHHLSRWPMWGIHVSISTPGRDRRDRRDTADPFPPPCRHHSALHDSTIDYGFGAEMRIVNAETLLPRHQEGAQLQILLWECSACNQGREVVRSRKGYITTMQKAWKDGEPGMDPHRQPSANVQEHCVVDPLSASSLTSHVAYSQASEAGAQSTSAVLHFGDALF